MDKIPDVRPILVGTDRLRVALWEATRNRHYQLLLGTKYLARDEIFFWVLTILRNIYVCPIFTFCE